MIKCKQVNDEKIKATFTIPEDQGEGRLSVVGDFNDWDPYATPMRKRGDRRTATVTLAPGRYRFRYLAEDGRWFNDPEATTYEPNPHGEDDCVLDLTEPT